MRNTEAGEKAAVKRRATNITLAGINLPKAPAPDEAGRVGRGAKEVYQLNETGAWQRRLRSLPPEPGSVTRLPARRSGRGRAETGMRVVRVPGGFAYVQDVPGKS
jgi:hypothetical protein